MDFLVVTITVSVLTPLRLVMKQAMKSKRPASCAGHVSFNLIDDTNKRCTSCGCSLHLVFFKECSSIEWIQKEAGEGNKRPTGFDFTSNKRSLVTVRAEAKGFRICRNSKRAGPMHQVTFSYNVTV